MVRKDRWMCSKDYEIEGKDEVLEENTLLKNSDF